ncbi:MAG: glutamate racemase [Xanthobacter sp.]
MPVSPVSLPAPTILVFDSGVGGLSVFREIAKAQPQAHFIYAADDAAFPYGALSDETLIARIGQVMDGLIAQYQPSLVVIACNTASTLALPGLRARHALPFVGTVPAVKPACAASVSRRISILATPATVRRDYTSSLIREFASACSVNLVPSSRLAGLVEEVLAGREVADADILAEIAPCFVDEGGQRTDAVVLACTHYPLLVERMQALAPWSVAWVDPAPAIARRVTSLLASGQVCTSLHPDMAGQLMPVRLVSTGRALDAVRVSALLGRPVSTPEILSRPLAAAS